MSILRFLFFFVLIAQPFRTVAQTENPAKEKLRREAAFVEQILSDAQNLRLPENRALVYGKIANVLWQTDEKRARRIFQDALNELIAAHGEAETERGSRQQFNNLIYGQSPRWEILNSLAARDADFALEAMLKTRPPKLTQALAQFSVDRQQQTTSQQFARNEIQSEQRLIALAADQNPGRAVKLLRESLKRDVSYETINLLKKIHQKDPETADALCAEVAQKLLDTKLSEDNQDFGFIQYFLSEFAQDKPQPEALKISDSLLRSLADKFVRFSLRPSATSYYFNDGTLKAVEKFFPASAVQLREKQKAQQTQSGQYQDYEKLVQSDASAGELLRRANKFPPSYRNELYRKAAEKTAQSGDLSGAQNILTANLPEEYAAQYLSQMSYNLFNQALSQGKLDEAGALATQIPDENMRFNALIQLAAVIYNKNPQENKEQAASVLNQARALLADTPEKSADMNSLTTLASGYVRIEPNEAFRLLETLVPPLNELSEASAVVAKFGDYVPFRRGEYQFDGGNGLPGVYNFVNTVKMLKENDFDRAVAITKGFSRLDVRLQLQLQLLNESGGNIQNLPIQGRSLQTVVVGVSVRDK